MTKWIQVVLAALVLLSGAAASAQEAKTPEQAQARQPAADELPKVVVHKSPTCGCCELWVRHMRRFGFQVETHDVQDLGAVKAEAGIPYGLGSCHTARVGGYFIEGHVPAEDVKRLLFEKPVARGLTVPGMPIGSPGMEQGERREPYDVLLVAKDGTTKVFAHHGD